MEQAPVKSSGEQIKKDFRIFAEPGFLVALGATFLLAAVVAGLLLYGAS